MEHTTISDFQHIFYPRSIAVFGVSSNGENAGSRFFKALLAAGFKGPVYAVNPTGGTAGTHKIYTDVKSIPEEVDNAIIAVPSRAIMAAMDDCISKGVKAAQIYTAGFKETGQDVDRCLEEALVEKARLGGVRIVGPNCMGVYSPAVNMPYGMTPYIGELGPIAFLSQSGGLGGLTLDMGMPRGLKFSKLVSFGNGSDLDSVDYLEYYAQDSTTRIIGTYLEGMRQGPRFLKLARLLFHKKPLVVWKGGRTETGAKAASSHTGSLASSYLLWKFAMTQAGVVRVNGVEEMTDTLLVFQQLGQWKGKGVAFVSGITGGGGGIGVTASDILTSFGLQMPVFNAETQKKLRSLLAQIGTIVHNPLDVGGGAIPTDVLYECLMAVLGDPAIDILIFHERTSNFLQINYLSRVESVNDVIIKVKNDQRKPVAIVSIPGTEETGRLTLEKKLEQQNIPVFPTLDRAAAALKKVSDYWNREI